jgi:hypothetical protein
VRAVKKTRKPKTKKATTIKEAHPQAKVAVNQAAPVADRALVKACPVDRAEAKECPEARAEAPVVVNLVKAQAEAPVVVNLAKARAEAPAVVNSNPRS